MYMLTVALLITAKNEDNPNIPYLRNGKKMWYFYRIEYYLAIKKREGVTHATT